MSAPAREMVNGPPLSERLSFLSLSSSRGNFTLKNIISRDNLVKKDKVKAGKGPIGLTTVYEPDGPCFVDVVFVHGLNGGSFSTWTCNGDISLFLPQE